MVEGGLYTGLYTGLYPRGAAGVWCDVDVDGFGDGGAAVDVDGLGDGELLPGMVAAVDVDGLGDGGGSDGDAGLLSSHGDLVAGTVGLMKYLGEGGGDGDAVLLSSNGDLVAGEAGLMR